MMMHAAGPFSRRRALAGAVVWSVALLGLVGNALPACQRPQGPPVQAGTYGDTPEELHRLWSDILTACQRDDRVRVHDLLASLAMTPAELTSLLGPQKSGELWSRYKAMMGSLCNVGAVELVAQVYEKKYDDIAVTRSDIPAPATNPGTPAAADLTDPDAVVRHALVTPTPFYTVRVKRKTAPSGLRYDFFVYRNGFWRSGNLLAKYLIPPPPLP